MTLCKFEIYIICNFRTDINESSNDSEEFKDKIKSPDFSLSANSPAKRHKSR